MSNMKNRILVDEKLAGVLREYYRVTTPTEELNALCFSTPQLQAHCCNALEKLEGGQSCTYCGHDPLKHCEYSCDVSKACLAAFAYRLGVGNGKPHTAVKKNLGLSYADLLREIRVALGDEVPKDIPEPEPVVPQMPEKAPEPAPAVIALPSKPPKATKPTVPLQAVTDTPTDLMSPKEAAQLWGCTPPNIYAKIKSGKLNSYTKGDSPTKLVSRAEIEHAKNATKSS